MEEVHDKKRYEIGFLAEGEEGSREVKDAIRKAEGVLEEEGPLQKIALAYPIKKRESADFRYIRFSALPAGAVALAKELRSASSVLRFLVISLTTSEEKGAERTEGADKRPRRSFESRPAADRPTGEPSASPLTNEVLEKKIEEILQ